jgi:glycosyltransferase involved in cell wall biosynthesis
MAKEADKIFSICGPYWYDTVESTPFAHWKPKMVRLDMAVDTNHFPFLRQEAGPMAFNPPGYRNLVFIGSAMPQKNLGYMTDLMARMPDVKLHWYGGSGDHPLAKLPNVSVIGWVTLDEAMAKGIIQNYDIMINTSISDANPTTLLEARAWGLITACTKESGYYNDPFFTELYLDDMDRTISVIRELLNAPTNDFYRRAVASRAEVESKYNWLNFCETVWSNLQALC